MTVAQKLAHFTCTLQYEQIPQEVIDKMKTCILHGTAIGLAGYYLVGGETGRNVLDELTGGSKTGEATVLGYGKKASVIDAAFATSAMFHGRIQEDTHGTMHIGTVCTPLAIALAEALHKDGKELLTTLVAAYEVEAAMGKDATAYSTAKGFRASSIYGVYGACAVASRMLGLTEEETVNAFAFASAFNFGMIGTPDTMEWRFEVGMAPRVGYMAALIAKNGAVGNPAYIEMNKGFLDCFAARTDETLSCADHLGTVWETKNVTFKLYPVCAFNQSHVINVMAMMEETPFDAAEIRRMTIHANQYEADYPGSKFTGPFNNHGQTAVSCPFSVAACVVKKQCTYENVTQYEAPEILSLIAKTEVIGEETMPPICSKIEIELEDGTVLAREMMVKEEYYSLSFERETTQILSIMDEIPLPEKQLKDLILEISCLEQAESLDRFVGLTIVPA